MKNYIKPELDLISIFAEENIASGASLLGNDEDVADGSSATMKLQKKAPRFISRIIRGICGTDISATTVD